MPLQQATPGASQAEASFHQALALAACQQAKAWELRAATRLAHLWPQRGKHAESRELLAPICGWLTEDFDIADLHEATVLIEALV